MAQILVRNIEDSAFERLKAKAGAAGKSTESFVRALIEREAHTDLSEAIAELDRLRALTPRRLADSSSDIIRSLRDGDRARR
jgi:plasmid stability protein